MVSKITTPPSQKEVIDKINEIADAGFITNSDYATQNTGGTIKTSSTYATGITNGQLRGVTRTYAQYIASSAADNMFISKGTLENVFTGKGFITSISSSDVTTALGYTPQEELTSGTNIKTINNNSLLGSGNLDIGGSSRNIGEIITSTIPLTDAGLHLLDGSLISGGSYSAFVDYVAGLVTDYPDLFETEANWQTSVTQYGVCGKFVYDSVNNTVRLPKITGFIEGASGVSNLGDLTEAGLPNIEGALSVWYRINYANGAFTPFGTGNNGGGAGAYGSEGANFDASNSNSIYGNSSTVQPQSIKVLYYIVIANATKTEIEVDIDEIATDLNGKADTDLTNINQTGENKIMNICAPDYANKESKSVNTTYTASADGYLICRVDGAPVGAEIYINEILVATVPVYTSYFCVANAVVAKGDTYRLTQTGGTYVYGYFVPMKGVN